MNLRDCGVYCLPNSRELVMLRTHENGPVVYTLGGWERFEMTHYEVNDAGQLVCQGKLTAWDIAVLTDTGRTAGEFSHSLDQPLSWRAPTSG
jgi:hypothetical protein